MLITTVTTTQNDHIAHDNIKTKHVLIYRQYHDPSYRYILMYRDICWTIGDPLSRYCKPVVASKRLPP